MLASYGGTCCGYKNENYDIALACVRRPLQDTLAICGQCAVSGVEKEETSMWIKELILTSDKIVYANDPSRKSFYAHMH